MSLMHCPICNKTVQIDIFDNVDAYMLHCSECMSVLDVIPHSEVVVVFSQTGVTPEPETAEEPQPRSCASCELCREEGEECHSWVDGSTYLDGQEIDYLLHIIDKQLNKVRGASKQLERTRLKLALMKEDL